MIDIAAELKRAKRKHPHWPDHIVSRGAIVAEEAVELLKDCLQWKYERDASEAVQEVQKDLMYKEAVQVAATAIRFLENLK